MLKAASCRAAISLVYLLSIPATLMAEDVGTTVVSPTKHDISPPLRTIKPIFRKFRGARLFEHKVRQLPEMGDYFGVVDSLVQSKAVGTPALAPPFGFEGIGAGLVGGDASVFSVESMPADATGAAGIDQYVQWVNTSFAVFKKDTGELVYGPAEGRTLWKGFGGPCETANDGDPIVLFDRMSRRWIMSQFAMSDEPFFQCIAVSTSADATGTYARYAFSFDDYNDYPKFAIWPDAYYGSYTMWRGNTFLGTQICAYDRAQMLAGLLARGQCATVPAVGALPADMEGASPPTIPVPNFIVGLAKSRLRLWKFAVNWQDPTKSKVSGPTNIDVQAFIPACRVPCVPQPAPGNPLESMGDRLMFRLSYRRRGTVESLLLNHSVFVSGFGGPNYTGIRWYEIRSPQGVPVVHQQATYAPDRTSRWMGSLAMDKAGNIALGFTASSTSIHPSIHLAGRSAADPASILSADVVIRKGTGTQTFDDWGHYSTMTLDPVDDCSMWFTSSYLVAVDRDRAWHTYISRARFADCQ